MVLEGSSGAEGTSQQGSWVPDILDLESKDILVGLEGSRGHGSGEGGARSRAEGGLQSGHRFSVGQRCDLGCGDKA